MEPLAPFQKQTLMLHGVCDKVRGDGDNHMRGIGCLLTGIELFPGNIQGGSDTPAGWSSGISIDQEIKNFLQADPATRTRFGSLEFGVLVPDRADTWTRMVYAGPNKPIAPIDDPYQMFHKLYGRTKDQRTRPQRARRTARRLEEDFGCRRQGRSSPAGRTRHVRSRAMEKELTDDLSKKDVGHAVPELEPGVQAQTTTRCRRSARCRST